MKIYDTWKTQLAITIIITSAIDGNDEECVMHWKGDNIEFMINDKEDDVDKALLASLVYRYQDNFPRFTER